jgi:hypothetical protein
MRLLLGNTEIVLGVPLRGRYLGQETLHVRFVGDYRPMEIARVPVDEDTTTSKTTALILSPPSAIASVRAGAGPRPERPGPPAH